MDKIVKTLTENDQFLRHISAYFNNTLFPVTSKSFANTNTLAEEPANPTAKDFITRQFISKFSLLTEHVAVSDVENELKEFAEYARYYLIENKNDIFRHIRHSSEENINEYFEQHPKLLRLLSEKSALKVLGNIFEEIKKGKIKRTFIPDENVSKKLDKSEIDIIKKYAERIYNKLTAYYFEEEEKPALEVMECH